MVKNWIIYANGKDLAECPVTQNDVGRHYKKGSSYYTPIMARFNNATPPSGYVTYNNGSHLQYKGNSYRYPWDISLTGGTKITANFQVKIISATTLNGSWVKAQIVGTDYMIIFVHVDSWARVGTIVKAGNQICKVKPMTGAHLHIDEWTGEKIYNLIVNGEFNTMNFKKGDNVIFSEDTNLRVGSGIKYNGKALIVKGAIGNVIGGSRQADGYEWWDIRFLDNQGWVANVGLNRLSKTTRVITQVNGKLPTPPTPEPTPDCSVQEARVLELEKGIGTLNKSIGTLELKLEACNKEKVDIQVLLKEKEAEVEDLREDLQLEQDKYATLMIEKKTIANTNMELVKKLNEFKSGRFMWVVDFLNKILPKKND